MVLEQCLFLNDNVGMTTKVGTYSKSDTVASDNSINSLISISYLSYYGAYD